MSRESESDETAMGDGSGGGIGCFINVWVFARFNLYFTADATKDLASIDNFTKGVWWGGRSFEVYFEVVGDFNADGGGVRGGVVVLVERGEVGVVV